MLKPLKKATLILVSILLALIVFAFLAFGFKVTFALVALLFRSILPLLVVAIFVLLCYVM